MIPESLYSILRTFLLDLAFSLQLISLSMIQKFIKVLFVFPAKSNPFSHLSVKNSKKGTQTRAQYEESKVFKCTVYDI